MVDRHMVAVLKIYWGDTEGKLYCVSNWSVDFAASMRGVS
jgi:hypothetical protein